jgi:hypothetical protein
LQFLLRSFCIGIVAFLSVLSATMRRESKKTRTHPAQAFAQLFGPFS